MGTSDPNRPVPSPAPRRALLWCLAALHTLASGVTLASADQVNFEKSKATVNTYSLHGPFGPTRLDLAAILKAKPKIMAKPEAEAGDEAALIGPRLKVPARITAPPPPGPPSEPSGEELAESTIDGGNIPKVFQEFSVDGTNVETRDLQIAASKTHVIITSSHRVTFWTREGHPVSGVSPIPQLHPHRLRLGND